MVLSVHRIRARRYSCSHLSTQRLVNFYLEPLIAVQTDLLTVQQTIAPPPVTLRDQVVQRRPEGPVSSVMAVMAVTRGNTTSDGESRAPLVNNYTTSGLTPVRHPIALRCEIPHGVEDDMHLTVAVVDLDVAAGAYFYDHQVRDGLPH